jgi:hypothetical protein
MTTKQITYFDKAGEENTNKTLDLAIEYAKSNNIKTIILSSSTGKTALELKKLAPDIEIIVVTYSEAVAYKDKLEKFENNRKDIEAAGIKIVKTTHAFSGIDKCVFKKYNSLTPNVLIADTLKLISEGTKVAVECALMAADAGTIKQKQQILALGGTSHGVDTCLLVEPSTTSNFFEFGILEIICMPKIGGLTHG